MDPIIEDKKKSGLENTLNNDSIKNISITNNDCLSSPNKSESKINDINKSSPRFEVKNNIEYKCDSNRKLSEKAISNIKSKKTSIEYNDYSRLNFNYNKSYILKDLYIGKASLITNDTLADKEKDSLSCSKINNINNKTTCSSIIKSNNCNSNKKDNNYSDILSELDKKWYDIENKSNINRNTDKQDNNFELNSDNTTTNYNKKLLDSCIFNKYNSNNETELLNYKVNKLHNILNTPIKDSNNNICNPIIVNINECTNNVKIKSPNKPKNKQCNIDEFINEYCNKKCNITNIVENNNKTIDNLFYESNKDKFTYINENERVKKKFSEVYYNVFPENKETSVHTDNYSLKCLNKEFDNIFTCISPNTNYSTKVISSKNITDKSSNLITATKSVSFKKDPKLVDKILKDVKDIKKCNNNYNRYGIGQLNREDSKYFNSIFSPYKQNILNTNNYNYIKVIKNKFPQYSNKKLINYNVDSQVYLNNNIISYMSHDKSLLCIPNTFDDVKAKFVSKKLENVLKSKLLDN